MTFEDGVILVLAFGVFVLLIQVIILVFERRAQKVNEAKAAMEHFTREEIENKAIPDEIIEAIDSLPSVEETEARDIKNKKMAKVIEISQFIDEKLKKG